MKRSIIISIIFCIVSCYQLKAQYDAQLTHYFAAWNYYNPAFAGRSDNLEAVLLNRMQWVGFKNAPKTLIISGNTPFPLFGRIHGVGAIMISESYGLFKHSLTAGQYAYKKKLGKGILSVGLQVGLLNDSFDGSKVILPDSFGDFGDGEKEEGGGGGAETDFPTSEVKGKSMDVNLGFLYSTKKWFIGFSVTHLFAPEISLGDNHYMNLPRGYYLMGGYNIQLSNPLIELRPSALVRSSMLIPKADSTAFSAQIDLSATVIYKKLLFGGLGCRGGYASIAGFTAAYVMLGGMFKSIEVGYAYDFPTSAIRLGSMGSHEIFARYYIDLNLGKGGKNKHKSVRIL